MAKSELEIVINAEDNASDKLDGLNGNLLNLSAGVDLIGAGFDFIGGIISSVASGVADFFGGMISSAMEAETNMAQLDAVLKSTGKTATVTFGGMTADMKKALDKLVAENQSAQDKMLNSQMSLADKQKEITSDVMLKLRRMDEDYADDRAQLEQRVKDATTATARKAAQERLAIFDAEYQKKRSRFQEDTARDLQDLQAKYDKETALLDASIKENQVKINNYNQIQAKTAEIIRPTKEQVLGLADALSKVTTFSDDTVISAENLLLTFTSIGKDIFPDATKIVLDMSTALGQDLKSSAIQLGKALQDPVKGISALSEVGVNFTDQQKTQVQSLMDSGNLAGAQMVILSELQKEFGGSAVAVGQTASGQWAIFQNTLAQVGQSVGGAILPGLQGALQSLMPYITQAAGDFAKLLGDPAMQAQIKAFGQWFGEQFVPILKEGIQWLADNGPGLMAQFTAWFQGPGPAQIKDTMGTVGGIVKDVGTALQGLGPVIDGIQFAAKIGGWLSGITPLLKAVDGLKKGIEDWGQAMQNLIKDIQNLTAVWPSWLTPGSPTPLEMGLRGINDAMGSVTGSIAATGGNMSSLAQATSGGGYGGGSVTVVYSPAMSLGNQAEFESQFVPMLRRAMGKVNRGAV